MQDFFLSRFFRYFLAVFGISVLTAGMNLLRNQINPITVALVFLLFILFMATIFGSKPAILSSIIAVFCLNFFFLPPVGTLTIADPENWIALVAFMIVSLTAGQLSAKAKERAEESEKLYLELQDAFEAASRAEAFKQNEKLKSALLDGVTHDLRTPLTSIKASVTMLLEENREEDASRITLEPQGRKELLEVINEETDRLNSFVESMVEVAKIEAGDFHLRKTATDVREIIINTLQRADNLSSSHTVKLKIPPGLPPVVVDEKAIAEVIFNLVDNAVKYSPAASKITISARQIEDFIEIAVEDEGAMIPVEERSKIFQKFYRADKSKKGFGMGLAIARGIIESHGGKIWVESAEQGNRFVFEIPVEADESS